MAKRERTLSLRRTILILFIIILVMSWVCYGMFIFKNWTSSSRKITEHIAVDANKDIYNQVNSLMHVPYHMNELNYKIIQNGMLDLSDATQRDRFFVGALETHNHNIYSFSFGTIRGEYYGARRNENGVIEIMRNNADTGGNSWYYSVKEDLTAGDLVLQAGEFDPRTRLWYREAVRTGF